MDSTTGVFAYLIGMAVFVAIFGFAAYAVTAFLMMKLFKKAGVQDAWRAWVPVYNLMIFFKLGDLSPWLVLYGLGGAIVLSWAGIGAIFSLALFALSAMAAYRIGLKFNKEPVWVALYAIVAVVWLAVIAFDGSRWNPSISPAPWAGNALLADRTSWAGVPGPQQDGSEVHEASAQPSVPAQH